MEIQPSNVKAISPEDRQLLMTHFNLNTYDLLAVGTEAEVYSRGSEAVVKIYADIGRLEHFEALRKFYCLLDETASGLNLPSIQEIATSPNAVGVMEQRIPGTSLESLMNCQSPLPADIAENLYFQAVAALSRVEFQSAPQQYLLFDGSGRSSTLLQTWPQFYSTLLRQKIAKVEHWLLPAIPHFSQKTDRLLCLLANEPVGPLSLIHGDIFPGNIMVAPDLSSPSGVIDFGSFTMFGNRILDVATSFGYYRMYDMGCKEIRERLLPRALALVTRSEHSSFYRYLLANAILTCDLYLTEPNPFINGHFQWALGILEHEPYWNRMN